MALSVIRPGQAPETQYGVQKPKETAMDRLYEYLMMAKSVNDAAYGGYQLAGQMPAKSNGGPYDQNTMRNYLNSKQTNQTGRYYPTKY